MIENTIEYDQDDTTPEEVKSIIYRSVNGELVGTQDLVENQIYAIPHRTETATHITLGYYLPEEAELIGADTVFNQEFRVRVTESDGLYHEQVLYHSVPIDPHEKMGPDGGFVDINENAYKEFYEALKRDGLFEWRETERRILAD